MTYTGKTRKEKTRKRPSSLINLDSKEGANTAIKV